MITLQTIERPSDAPEKVDSIPTCTGKALRSFLGRHSHEALREVEKNSEYALYHSFDQVAHPNGDAI